MTKDRTAKKIYLPAFLIFLASIIFLARLHTYNEPLEQDITTYAVIAHEMLEGRELYSDLVDIKPPGIFFTYAATELIAGYGVQSVFLLNILAAIITMLGVYFAGTALSGGNRAGGMLAAGIWTVISGEPLFQANQPNVEVILNSCFAWSFAVLVSDYRGIRKHKHLIAGALIAFATLHKQISIVIFPFFYSIYVISPPASARKREIIDNIITAGSIIVISWLIISCYFILTGRFEDFYDVIVIYSRSYAGNIWKNILNGLTLQMLAPLSSPVVFPLLILTILGVITGIMRKKRQWYMLSAYLLSVQIMVSLPGRFFHHYYQLWLPLVAVGAGVSFVEIYALLKNRYFLLSRALTAAVLLLLLIHQVPLYRMSPDEWSRKKYGELFILIKEMAGEIDGILEPEETFYEFGSDSGLYFYSRRTPPTGIFLVHPLAEKPLRMKYSQRIIKDLEKNKPELLILPRELPAEQPVISWISSGCWNFIQDNYYGFFILFARCDGRLDLQLKAGSNVH